jgi:thiol:disulfide interchange protein DsbA
MHPVRLASAGLYIFLLWAAPGWAQDFNAGFEYRPVPKPLERSAGDSVLVQEFFWYGCPACNSFEPFVQAYRADLPKGVEFEHVPAVLNPRWENHARAFYTAEVLGVLDKIHGPLFEAIHREGRRLGDRESLAEFFVEHGVPEADFNRTFRSFAVQTRLNRAGKLAERFGVRAVPTVVVNGRYLSDRNMAGGNRELIDVIRFLATKESG